MLDGRVYRTAFLPALVALFVAAFALQDRPKPARTPLAADVFTAERARETLDTLGALPAAERADAVARTLAAPGEGGERSVFVVHRSGETVVATRPGLSPRRIVVLADRDANGPAALSGTATLLELARVFRDRELRKTLVIVSTTGARDGFTGIREWAKAEAGGPVDGVLVLGDVGGAGIRKPWVISWPSTSASPPLALERTVRAAVRRETRSDAGGPHAVGQWVRRALPVTVSAQGPIGAEGLPAVLLSESGELGPSPDERVLDSRLRVFGRAAVRAVSAIDGSGPRDEPAFAGAPSGIVTMRNVLPDWAARLIVGSALLPALLAALDAFFRARRRRVSIAPWVAWLAVAAVPLPVAWLWLRALGAVGAIEAPSGPVISDRFALDTSGIVSMASALLAGALACWVARLAARAWGTRTAHEPATETTRRSRPVPGVEGLAVATAVWLCALAALTWILNPYAAGLLVPAAHLWLFAAGGWRGWGAVAAIAAGLLLPLLAVVHLGLALSLGPLALAWGAALGAATGAGLGTTLLFAGLLAALAGVVRVVAARRRMARAGGGSADAIRTRGPLTYAGPGSLGGTESALRR